MERFTLLAEMVLGEIALGEIALGETALGEIAVRRNAATPFIYLLNWKSPVSDRFVPRIIVDIGPIHRAQSVKRFLN